MKLSGWCSFLSTLESIAARDGGMPVKSMDVLGNQIDGTGRLQVLILRDSVLGWMPTKTKYESRELPEVLATIESIKALMPTLTLARGLPLKRTSNGLDLHGHMRR